MITIIACMAQNRVIGRDGRTPWRFSADLRNFKQVTTGNILVMGRKTFEETGALPRRKTVVLSRKQPSPESNRQVAYASSVDEAATMFGGQDVFIAGGAQVYAAYLGIAEYMMLTYIHRDIEGDTFFPTFDANQWDVVKARRGNQHSYIEMRRR